MNNDVTFGEVQERNPESNLRPDENHFFATLAAFEGEPNENDLPVFVDIDVMRELENHANDDTRVELGGVLMGQQHIDRQGRPFVVVQDSIRAKHYQATRGSFKFTHDTWQQISRDRGRMHSNMQMVGWYHTHPGWGVFLSGMDDFICKNFFSRPQDLALVIDPCKREHGWFQWHDGQTQLTAAIYWTAHRSRLPEIESFASSYSKEPEMSLHRNSQRGITVTPGTTVQVIERDHHSNWIQYGFLSVQLLGLILIAWMVYASTSRSESVSSELDSQAALLKRVKILEIKNEILRELIGQLVANPTQALAAYDELASAREEMRHAEEAITSHLSRIQSLEVANRNLEKVVQKQERENAELATIAESKRRLAPLNASTADSKTGDTRAYFWPQDPMTLTIIGVLLGLGSIAGVLYWISRRNAEANEFLTDEVTDLATGRDSDIPSYKVK